jgi:hypothetical protein
MEKAKRARKAETPKQPSLRLKLRAPYLYPDLGDSPECEVLVSAISVGWSRHCGPHLVRSSHLTDSRHSECVSRWHWTIENLKRF